MHEEEKRVTFTCFYQLGSAKYTACKQSAHERTLECTQQSCHQRLSGVWEYHPWVEDRTLIAGRHSWLVLDYGCTVAGDNWSSYRPLIQSTAAPTCYEYCLSGEPVLHLQRQPELTKIAYRSADSKDGLPQCYKSQQELWWCMAESHNSYRSSTSSLHYNHHVSFSFLCYKSCLQNGGECAQSGTLES